MPRTLPNERAMLSPIHLWLAQLGYFTKYEFQLPWGICDLVGVKPQSENIVIRRQHGPKQAIGGLKYVSLLSNLPSGSSTFDRVQKILEWEGTSDSLESDLKALHRRGFIRYNKKERNIVRLSQPKIFDSIIAIEFKLERVEEVLLQATHHKKFTTQTYAAFPSSLAKRVITGKTGRDFVERGVGIIALDGDSCAVVLEARPSIYQKDAVFETHVAERFWPDILEAVKH